MHTSQNHPKREAGIKMIMAIAFSSAAAGLLDITASGLLAKSRGMAFKSLLQFVASGALGDAAFQGGTRTAVTGMLFHFLITALWATAYFLISDKLSNIHQHPFVFGALYGVVVHLVMSLVVLPLSRTRKKPFAWQPWVVQLAVHIICVGLPIALVQNCWLRA
jgi:cbb3-type cytochrome oxidase subunit 1